MGKRKSAEEGQEGLGPELEALLAKVPPPKAPAWFAAKTLARLRKEETGSRGWIGWLGGWRWAWTAGAAAVVAGWIFWGPSHRQPVVSDAMVFAALDALVEQDEENRWWAGL